MLTRLQVLLICVSVLLMVTYIFKGLAAQIDALRADVRILDGRLKDAIVSGSVAVPSVCCALPHPAAPAAATTVKAPISIDLDTDEADSDDDDDDDDKEEPKAPTVADSEVKEMLESLEHIMGSNDDASKKDVAAMSDDELRSLRCEDLRAYLRDKGAPASAIKGSKDVLIAKVRASTA